MEKGSLPRHEGEPVRMQKRVTPRVRASSSLPRDPSQSRTFEPTLVVPGALACGGSGAQERWIARTLERWNAGLLSAADGASVVRRSAPGTAVSGPGSGGWRTTN